MDKDLKDTIRKLEEAKRRQEKLEKTIIILSGLLIVIVFTVIGINLYSGKNEKISEPEINIINEKSPDIAKINKEETANVVQKGILPTTSNITTSTQSQIISKSKSEQIEKKEKTEKSKVVIIKKPEKIEKRKETPQKKEIQKKKITSANTKNTKKEEKKASVQTGYYYIQVGAFSSKENAERAKKNFKISPSRFVIIRTGKLYKLLIGKFKTRKEAQNFMRKYGIKGIIKKI
ncbi:MAG: hypothetical protein GXO21_07060 [Aquificae bacterium]|nr:hypothetical protein [Aquificota bacterium]